MIITTTFGALEYSVQILDNDVSNLEIQLIIKRAILDALVSFHGDRFSNANRCHRLKLLALEAAERLLPFEPEKARTIWESLAMIETNA